MEHTQRDRKSIRTGLLRKTCLLLLFINGLLTVPVYAQEIRVNLVNKPLKRFIEVIEQQTDYKFFYEERQIDVEQPVSVNLQQADIDTVLREVFKNADIAYSVSDKRILLVRKKTDPSGKKSQSTQIISGQVMDSEGFPVIGANIRVKNTTIGGITDIDGAYTLEVPEEGTLVVSYIGYATHEVALSGDGYRKIILTEDAKMLDDVIVIGYGTMKKRDLTGAVSTVKTKDIGLAGASSIGHVLVGKAAGLYVRQNSAQPGGGLDILVRGAGSVNASNDPLYIVDGFPIAKLDQIETSDRKMNPGTQGILNFLNPNDVESVEVLKDASATSIYGARAANGVVIITTKRGKEGKARVNYLYNYSYQRYSDRYDLLSLQEWMVEKNKSTWELWLWNNKVSPWGTRTMEEALASPVNGLKYSRPYTEEQIKNAGQGTDWLGLVTRNGQIREHNINLQGGSKETQYMLSFNYFDHKGIIRNSGLTRYTMKTNIDQRFLDIFKTGLNLTLTRIANDNTQLGKEQYENSGIIRSAIQMGPHIKAYDPETGKYPVNPLLGTQPNPYSLLNNIDRGNIDRLLGNIFIEAVPLNGLTLRVNAGLDYAAQSRKTYQPKTTLNGHNLQGVATIYNVKNNQYLLEATATYQKTFANIHKMNLLAGTSYERFNYESSNLGNNKFLTDAFMYHNLGGGTGTKIVGSRYTDNKMLSYFFRANYVLKDRYLVTATLRADGASVFAQNHKWGYFPSVALGWTVSEEAFMRKMSDWLSMLKLRVSWGQTGNSDISTNAFPGYYTSEAWNKEDKSKEIGVFQQRFGNPNLKWETTTEWNLGIDFGLFNNRITGSAEYYDKVISDLLSYKPLNTYQELTRVMANIGKTQSTGIEVTLNTRNMVLKNFSWTTDFTFTKYKDRWKERTDDWKPAIYEKYDAPVRPIYARRASHIMQKGEKTPKAQPLLVPGQVVIKDNNGYVRDKQGNPVVDENGRFKLLGHGDDIIDDADTELIGSADPGWLAGMTNTLRYGNCDLSFHLNGMFDRLMQDPTALEYGISADGIARYGYNALRMVKNRWTWDNPSTTHPSSFYGWNNNYTAGDFFYQKAWFIRMQNITFGYTFPKRILSGAKVISHLRVHAAANNLFLITPYKGLDPETDYYTASYPNAKTFSFGVDLSF